MTRHKNRNDTHSICFGAVAFLFPRALPDRTGVVGTGELALAMVRSTGEHGSSERGDKWVGMLHPDSIRTGHGLKRHGHNE